MARPGPRKIYRYSDEFRATAVRPEVQLLSVVTEMPSGGGADLLGESDCLLTKISGEATTWNLGHDGLQVGVEFIAT